MCVCVCVYFKMIKDLQSENVKSGRYSVGCVISHLPTPPLGQDMTQGKVLSRV